MESRGRCFDLMQWNQRSLSGSIFRRPGYDGYSLTLPIRVTRDDVGISADLHLWILVERDRHGLQVRQATLLPRPVDVSGRAETVSLTDALSVSSGTALRSAGKPSSTQQASRASVGLTVTELSESEVLRTRLFKIARESLQVCPIVTAKPRLSAHFRVAEAHRRFDEPINVMLDLELATGHLFRNPLRDWANLAYASGSLTIQSAARRHELGVQLRNFGDRLSTVEFGERSLRFALYLSLSDDCGPGAIARLELSCVTDDDGALRECLDTALVDAIDQNGAPVSARSLIRMIHDVARGSCASGNNATFRSATRRSLGGY